MPHVPRRATPAARGRPPRVALLIPTSTGWGRRLVHGILLYSRKHGPWNLWIEPHAQDQHLRVPPGWQGDGVIARVALHAMADELKALQVPIVNISGIRLKGVDLPRVTTDPRTSAEFAVQHFLDRGFGHFGYVGILRFEYVAEHYRAFATAAAAAGADCDAYKTAPGHVSWPEQQEELARWLARLPKPLAVVSWGLEAMTVIDACRLAGLHVPEQVAVLAGDEDEILCEVTTPPLSGIENPTELIGSQAAAILDRMMRGHPAPKEPVLLKPTRVVTRQSTDTLSIEDPELADAIRFIRENAGRLIDVGDVLEAVPISRRSLERRFEQVLGRTPAEEIRRVHLERAEQLLVETDMPIPDIAAASGFGSPEYLSHVLKSATGMTPLKYRSHLRAR